METKFDKALLLVFWVTLVVVAIITVAINLNPYLVDYLPTLNF